MWERYCRGVNAIVYMVDAADHDKIEVRIIQTEINTDRTFTLYRNTKLLNILKRFLFDILGITK